MDLNGDGKHDWKDDAILYHVVNESDSEKEQTATEEVQEETEREFRSWLKSRINN